MSEIQEYQNVEVTRNELGDSYSVQAARATQEVQGQILMAKKFPRNEAKCLEKILTSCQRKKLAEKSQYAYPRGETTVFGPSIRLAEVVAQNWGNLSYGIHEIDQVDGESIVEAFCWDLESNTKQSKIFKVKHERKTKKRGIEKLEDPRDVYELVANYGSRRVRACILGIIPQDIIEEAVEECNKTLSGNNSDPIEDRVRKMVGAFNKIGVKTELIETLKDKELKFFNTDDIGDMVKIYNSIKDGMSKVSDWFKPNKGIQSESSKSLTKSIEQSINKKEEKCINQEEESKKELKD